MKRKFLSAFLVAILLLCSILLSSCGNDGPLSLDAFLSTKDRKMSYAIDEKYMITLKYGHCSTAREEFVDKSVGYISCWGYGYGEDGTQVGEVEVLLEIPSYYSKDNYVERKLIGIGVFTFIRIHKYNQEVTLEIPKSHILSNKGRIVIALVSRAKDDPDMLPLNDTRNGAVLTFTYEKIDGEIHFALEK